MREECLKNSRCLTTESCHSYYSASAALRISLGHESDSPRVWVRLAHSSTPGCLLYWPRSGAALCGSATIPPPHPHFTIWGEACLLLAKTWMQPVPGQLAWRSRRVDQVKEQRTPEARTRRVRRQRRGDGAGYTETEEEQGIKFSHMHNRYYLLLAK